MIKYIVLLLSVVSLAQQPTADGLLKSVIVAEPLDILKEQFNSIEINDWETADPRATSMTISYYAMEGDSLILDKTMEFTRKEEYVKEADWNYIEKRVSKSGSYELKFEDRNEREEVTNFVIDNDRLMARYTATDSIVYSYQGERIYQIDHFERDPRVTDGSLIYEDEMGKSELDNMVIEETVIEETDNIEDYPEESVIEVEEGVYETTISDSGDDDYEIVEVLPAPLFYPSKTVFYTYNEKEEIITMKTLKNRTYRNRSQVEELLEETLNFVYLDDKLTSFSQKNNLLMTAEGLPENLSLNYWSEHIKENNKAQGGGVITALLTYDESDRLVGLKIGTTEKDDEDFTRDARIFYEADQLVKMVSDRGKGKTIILYTYNEDGFMVQQVQEEYKNDELIDKSLMKRVFSFE